MCYEGFGGSHCENIIGLWLEWKQWSPCNPLCGKVRKRSRSRECSDPTDMAKCYIIGNEFNISQTYCNPRPCVIEGSWSEWSIWSSCEKGFHKRRRECERANNTDVQILNLDCLGVRVEKKKCYFSFYFELVAPILTTIIMSTIIFSFIAIYLHQLIKIYKNRIKKLKTKNKKI
jgi:hypothetical protein